MANLLGYYHNSSYMSITAHIRKATIDSKINYARLADYKDLARL